MCVWKACANTAGAKQTNSRSSLFSKFPNKGEFIMVPTYRTAGIIKRYVNWPSDSEWYIGGTQQIVINSDSHSNYNM